MKTKTEGTFIPVKLKSFSGRRQFSPQTLQLVIHIYLPAFSGY